jgi:ADP-ribose pyrophosphatase YjhB (NUDIX family)
MLQRKYPEIPIPSVGAIIVGTKGILLVKRDKPPYKGLWNIVSGVINVGETQEEAVTREVREETGIEGEVMRFVETGDVIVKDNHGRMEYHFMVNVYLFRALSENSDIMTLDTAWFHPQSLPAEDMVDSVYKALRGLGNQLLKIMQLKT